MAYASGTANSPSDLLTGIRNACTANGWTLSGNVLHKGTCYAEVMINSGIITNRGGTGIDGSNNLTGATDRGSAQLGVTMDTVPFSWPVAYEAFINTSPDEVYVVVKYSVVYWQNLSFGQSTMPGLVGTGNWYCGSYPYSSDDRYCVSTTGENGLNPPGPGGSLFCSYRNAFGVHHALDSSTWIVSSPIYGGNFAGSAIDWSSLFFRQPNQWNGEAILIPVRVYAQRPSGFISPVLECAHARFVSLANLNDGQIITLGSDKWKVYPWFTRNRTSNSEKQTFAGHAFRYDGP